MQTASVRARCGAGHERQQETGLSLIELLVAMTVAAVLLSVAIPSYSYLINASRLTSTANDFVAAVNQARLGAIKRNGSTQVCRDRKSELEGTGGALRVVRGGSSIIKK